MPFTTPTAPATPGDDRFQHQPKLVQLWRLRPWVQKRLPQVDKRCTLRPMQRRSLLGLILASPVGILIPDVAKAAILPGSQYRDFNDVTDDIVDFAAQSIDSEVLSADDPQRREVGFAAFYVEGGLEYQRHWSIRVTELQRLIEAMPEGNGGSLVEDGSLSPSGRKELIKRSFCTQEG